MHAAVIHDGRKLIPVGAGFMHDAYVIVSSDDTYLLMPTPAHVGYLLRSDRERWKHVFPSLHGVVAYVNTIERAKTAPHNAA